MELGLCLDDDFFAEEGVKEKPKEKPYNVKLCEREWIFKSPICNDKVEKQNITKFQADFWYRTGQYSKALKSYQFIQENPQVASSTVEREITESVARCHIKLEHFDEAVHLIHKMLKDQGDDTSLILMLAKICSTTGDIQGEIACMKRCISLHSYNHYFWQSLALAYSKAYESKESFDFTSNSQNGKIHNAEHYTIANKVAEALGKNKTTNHKDSLKIYINCCHCKCLGQMNLPVHEGEKLLPKVTDQNGFGKEENRSDEDQEERPLDSDNENTFTRVMDEIVIFTKELSIDGEIERQTKENRSMACNLPKSEVVTNKAQISQSSVDDSCRCPMNAFRAALDPGKNIPEEDQGHHCSFSVKLKSSKYYQHQTKELLDKRSLKDKQNLFGFFCLVRARFHLQRGIWTSSSFIKDRLTIELAEVNERIDKYELCKCGGLKKCCLKKIETEEAAIVSEQMGETEDVNS